MMMTNTSNPLPVKVRHSFIKIPTGSELSKRQLPIMSVDSGIPGPVVWLTACCHGDEVGGVVIIQEIFKKIRNKTILSRGSVFAFPLMNPIGFETASRRIPLSNEDLNRSFPGNKDGSLGERLADMIFTTILKTNPTVVLDLHNDWIKSIPYVLIDPEHRGMLSEVYQATENFGSKTGFLMIRDTEEIQKSLCFSLHKQNIPAMTLELGESCIINEKNVAYGVKSIEQILAYLKMIKPEKEPFQYHLPEINHGKILNYFARPYSSTSGIIRFLVKPGERVKKGQAVAKIYNTFGRLQQTLAALHDGVVLGHSDSSVAFPGKPILAFGIE